MDQEPQVPLSSAPTYHGFWPVLLIGLSILLLFIWEMRLGILTRQTALQLKEQQVRLVDQAQQVQTRLEKLVRALVELSKTDDEAKKLVAKFGIKLNNPSLPAAIPSP